MELRCGLYQRQLDVKEYTSEEVKYSLDCTDSGVQSDSLLIINI